MTHSHSAPVSAVFVVGMPRSGTTLLSTMLDAHPDVVIAPETQFFSLSPFDVEDPAFASEAVDFLLQQPGVQDMDLSEEEIRTVRASASEAARPTDVLRVLLETYAARFNASVWGEKTPDHLVSVPLMARRFPDAVFVSIVRDPRDVCLSLREMPWNRDSLPEAAWTWRRYARRTEEYQARFVDRFLEVRYEDLLRDPTRELQKVCGLLKVPFQEEMLTFHETAHDAVSAEPWKAKTKEPVDPSNAQKWKTQMGPAARWVVEQGAGEMLTAKGYPTSPTTVDAAFVRDLLRVAAETIRDVARRIVRRWQTPTRKTGDYTPVWIRQGDAER